MTDDFVERLLAAIEQRESAGKRALPYATGSRYEGQPADWVHFVTGMVGGVLTICAEHRALVERYTSSHAHLERLAAAAAAGNAAEDNLRDQSKEAARSAELLAVLQVIAGSYAVQRTEEPSAPSLA